ncbi:response regulator transcription factor [Streptomyces sp. 35G-GA-8]|uniref:LuxR C-terminal-related transcriptional regulator n=1 Tax=Streptomyces sp. 35G-GA-8 TaxID=2939434 RepID=UPI00201FB16A|nr:response regulator transcription factor [Streptomyces sp. 35G-GA-8]MCL7382251.1 response regulator transcription factor [Streptomyces sp. 35G-GA-8]
MKVDRVTSGESAPHLTVVLADDHLVVRAGMRLLLSQDTAFDIVAESSTLPETFLAVERHHPSVLVLDLTLAGQSSLRSIPELLATSPRTRILVLTMQEDPAFAREALRIGAVGYLLKEAAAEELLGAARQVAAGATYVQPSLGARLAVTVPGTSTTGMGAGAGADDSLTAREVEVLSLLALGHTNQEIAEQVHVSVRTVETHRARIREKLGAETKADLVTAARELGLLA